MNVGIIGLGHIGKRHMDNVLENPNLELLCVAEPNLEVEVPQGVGIHYNFVDMLNQYGDELNLVIVATPNCLHYRMIRECVERGIPVLAEKPIVLNKHEAKLISQLVNKTQVPVFVNYPLRFLKSVSEVKNRLGEIGKPNMTIFNVFWNRNEEYYTASDWRGTRSEEGGPLFNEFIHHLNLLKYLFGEIENVGGNVYDFNHSYTEVEDSGNFNFTFMSGGMGSLNYSVAAPKKSFDVQLTVMGDVGCFRLKELYLNNLKIDDEEEQTFEINLQHFYDVLEATRLRITEGIEDERLCTVSEACADVHDIQTFYSQFKMTDKPKGTEQPLFLKGTF